MASTGHYSIFHIMLISGYTIEYLSISLTKADLCRKKTFFLCCRNFSKFTCYRQEKNNFFYILT